MEYQVGEKHRTKIAYGDILFEPKSLVISILGNERC